jgi:hypothetical protein
MISELKRQAEKFTFQRVLHPSDVLHQQGSDRLQKNRADSLQLAAVISVTW